MRVDVKDTGTFALVDGVRCRKWEGRTDDGMPVTLYTVAVAGRTCDLPAMVDGGLEWLKADRSNAVVEPAPRAP
jgi:hypothetical protein